jgi:hypothetical protein
VIEVRDEVREERIVGAADDGPVVRCPFSIVGVRR